VIVNQTVTYENTALDALKSMPIWKLLNSKNKALAELAARAMHLVAPHLRAYEILFPHYTDHSYLHSLRVIEKMYELMKEPKSHNATELFFCIYSALFHDVGMIVSEKVMNNEIKGITNDYVLQYLGNGEEEDQRLEERRVYLRNKIRTEHGNRAWDTIKEWFENDATRDLFFINNTPIFSYLTELCKSHMQSADEIGSSLPKNKLIGKEQYNPIYIAVLLRLADAFDFSPDRAPKSTFNNYDIADDENSYYHWAMNNGINEGITITDDTKNNDKKIIINPTPIADWLFSNPGKNEDDYLNVQSNIFAYYQWLEEEIRESCTLLDYPEIEDKYKIAVRLMFSDDPKRFADYIPNFMIRMNYETVVTNLLGMGLYGEPRVGLREIIQNSIDACRWRAASGDGYSNGLSPLIEIVINERDGKVYIIDNGIGMTLEVVKTSFLGIGNSIYNNTAFTMSREQFGHIGKHGIGFFATFMLSDNVKIKTRHLNSGEEIWVSVTSKKENAFIRKNKTNPIPVGTQIILIDINEFKTVFKPCCKEEKNEAHAVKHYIEGLFLNDDDPITFMVRQIDKDGGVVENLTCDVSPLQKKVAGLGKVESLSDCFVTTDAIESYARFDSETHKRRLFCWNPDKAMFEENYNWSCLPEDSITICTIKKFEDSASATCPIVLYVQSNENSIDPFGLVNSKYREKTYYETSKAFNGAPITIKEFCESIGFNITYPIGAFAERVLVRKRFNSTLLLREHTEFEDSAPRTQYVRSGKSYYDKIYARNVFVPNAHLKAPYLLVAIDGSFSGELQDLIVNIKSNKIYPNLKRDNLSEADIENVSYAVARALMHRQVRNHPNLSCAIDTIVNEFFNKKNIFSKEN